MIETNSQVKNKKSIFIFSWGYPSNSTKGNPFVEDAVHLAHDNGIQTTVVVFQFKNIIERFFSLKKHLTYSSKRGEEIAVVSIYNIPMIPIGWRKRLILWQAKLGIKNLIHRVGKPDLLQQHYIFHSMPYITDHIAKTFDIPYVLFEHSPIYNQKHFDTKFQTFCHPYFSRAGFKAFIDNAQDVFAYKVQTTALTGYFGRNFKTFDGFLPNYLLSAPSTHADEVVKTAFTVACIGTLDDRKGTLRLIEAFSKIPMAHQCQLVFCGAGPYLERAKTMIHDFGLENNITITGFIPRASVIAQLKASDYLVIASSYETFGMTCIEAMAYGIPVISTKCGGPETIINESVGILCENNDIPALTEALIIGYQNKDKYSAVAIQKHFHDHYSETCAWNKMKEIYFRD
jgi:glycosyltransferase involved in cell wall biosynthesis